MEPVYFGDKIASKTQPSAQAADVHLQHEVSVGASSTHTPQSLRDQITVRIDGVVWHLPFVKWRMATPGVLFGEVCAEFEVEDRTLLQTVYGHTYERVSAVDDRAARLSAVDMHA